MKKLFTLFFGLIIAVSAFTAPITLLYLVEELPFKVEPGKHDTEMETILKDLGHLVTTEAMAAGGTTTGYDVIFTSESVGSGNAGWPTYKTAPLPMVMGKVWAIKGPALGWVKDENSGTDYGNSADSIFVKKEDHDIQCGLDDEFGIVKSGSKEDAIGAFVNFTLVENPSGTTVIYTAKVKPEEHTVVAIDKLSTLNGNTLQNDVVIYGVHQVVYDELNSNAITLLNNCIQWAAKGEVEACAPITSIRDAKKGIEAAAYPNPTTGTLNINFEEVVNAATITIMTVDGRSVRTSDIFSAESTTLDVSDLNTGIYILNISGSDIQFSQTINVQ